MASKTKVTSSTGRTQPGQASEGAHNGLGLEPVERGTSLGPRPTETQMTGAASATSGTGSATEERTVVAEARDLQRVNRELQVRIRELELQLTGGAQQADREAADYGEASEESNTVITIIKDLHSKVDAAQELKEALEADVAAMKAKLAEEQAARAELEARVKLLDAKVALGDQLREDLAFVEEERNEIARRLEQATSDLGKTAAQCDRLVEQRIADEARIKELQSDKIALEAKVLNLQEMVADTDRLRQELAGIREESQRLKEAVQGLKGKLDASEVARNAVELDLTTMRELVRNQNQQLDELKKNLATAYVDLTDLRARLDQQEAENAHLVEFNKRADRELKTMSARLESTKRELDQSKQALRDIRAAAMRTATQIREHVSGAAERE